MFKQKAKRSKLWNGRLLIRTLLALLLLVVALLGVVLASAWKKLGKMPAGAHLQRLEASPHFRDGRFWDLLPREEPNLVKILPKWLETSVPHRRPEGALVGVSRKGDDFKSPPASGLRITWLGHSTMIIEIGGKRALVDPIWGDYASPVPVVSLRRFIDPPLPFEELPPIDLVLISHDHYDHLDYPTILRLAEGEMPFYVPLGVGSHLQYWGISPERIIEHDWWTETTFDETLTVVCTPARHFSGRFLADKDKTLWASWVLLGEESRVFFSGDTAMLPELTEIGRRYGPFDATMIEIGAYHQMWVDVHLGPEQAVQAHQMLGGAVMIPIHWGMFDLGLHGWTEPIERTLVAARQNDVSVATLRPGESIEPSAPTAPTRYWPELPWTSAEHDPVISTGLSQ